MKQEEIDARLFDLIESTKFEDLSASDRAFVLANITEAEYRLHGAIHSGAQNDDVFVPTPLPLTVSNAKSVWYKRPIPLYQVISGAAVLVLLVWFMRNPETAPSTLHKKGKTESLMAKTHLIYDTIIREIPVYQTAIRYIHDTVKEIQYELYTQAPERELQVARELAPLALTVDILKSNATSLKDDKTAGLLTQSLGSDRFGGR